MASRLLTRGLYPPISGVYGSHKGRRPQCAIAPTFRRANDLTVAVRPSQADSGRPVGENSSVADALEMNLVTHRPPLSWRGENHGGFDAGNTFL